ncbi:hypothetical protein [Alkalibacterium olivapovliticus]|uniref:hypothetical protein n=1 Tax=Alkalibacterium olivapovliticus TaxID=99907 RepID=UPI0014751705|nr:hypothetical protein [Alkalibacterium olivapovliticus]
MTKKQLFTGLVLAVVAVLLTALLDLPAGATPVFILVFTAMGAYFRYQNTKDSEE